MRLTPQKMREAECAARAYTRTLSLQPSDVHIPAAGDSTRSKATSYENAPFVDRAWDASAATGRLKTWAGITGDIAKATPAQRAKFAKGFAGVRDDGTTQDDYVLPHHDIVDGKFVTIPAGVSAALARVDQTQGFSDSERASMRKHLERHRDEWEREKTGARAASADDLDVRLMRAVVTDDTAENRIIQTRDPRTFRLTSRRLLISFEPEEEGKPPRSWIQIARPGRYLGHPQGAFEFNASVFEKIIENFLATENREVPIDFEHATELPGSEGSIPQNGAPATGFCLELRAVDQGGLFGLVEWLEPGLGYIRAGRYRRFSPAVQFDAAHPVSGKKIGPQLTSGALTNRPFLDGMTRLVA